MPKRIEKYQLGRTLGSGTFSKVKLAVDTIDNSHWAIKIVDRKMVQKENMEAQLKREIAIMKILKHKHVVQLREVLQSSKRIYIVLELITGGELFDRIVEAKRFDENTARKYFQQLISGIEYCHSQGIAHRDLKPENLLLDENDVLKISDFGLSALSGSDGSGKTKMLMTTCGTPNYVAPEVLKEQGYDGKKADVWSVGVILYVMLAGYLPFEDQTMKGLFSKIEAGKFSYPSHFTADQKDLISKMLVVDPNKRISIDQIINHKWFNVGFKREQSNSQIKLTDKEIDQSVKMTTEEVQSVSSGTSSQPTTPKAGTLNAFDLASILMAGSMNPLISKGSEEQVKFRRQTRFMAKGNKDQVQTEICKRLEEVKAKPSIKGEEIRGVVTLHQNAITFSITIEETSGGFSVVEVRRNKGDILAFNSLYRELLVKLGKVVVSREIKN
ncbi:hypothetical protein ABK040_004692 [Willaertia magna]